MVIIDTVINTLFGGLTLDPAGMHCPSWDDAFVSSYGIELSALTALQHTLHFVDAACVIFHNHQMHMQLPTLLTVLFSRPPIFKL